MKLRIGLVLAGSLAVFAGACASGGGGSPAGSTSTSSPLPGAETLAQGESPRQDENTRAAANHIQAAQDAESPDAARPEYQAAVQSAQQSINEDPTNPLPWYQQGIAYIGLGDYFKADTALTKAETLRPVYTLETESRRERAWLQLYQQAVPLVNSGQYEQAVNIFEEANAIYRGRPEVMVTLGQIYQQLGEWDKSLENLRAALEIIQSDRTEQMDSATAANWREQGEQIPAYIAQALMQSGDYRGAVQALRSLLADDPDNLTYMRNLATVYLQMEQPDSAAAMYAQILRRPNLRASDYYQVGVGLYQMDDYDGATDAFKKAAEASVNDRDAVEMWARSIQLAHADSMPAMSLDELKTAADRWLQLDPNNRNAYLIRAQVASKTGDDDTARDLVEKIEALPVLVENLQLQRYREGGGIISGQIRNVSLDQGTSVTLHFSFYDDAGTAIGTKDVTVQAPAADATSAFQAEWDSDQVVAGYGYTLQTM